MIDAAPGHAVEAFTLMGWTAGDAEHEVAGMIGTGEAITCRVQRVPVIVEGESGTIYDAAGPGARCQRPAIRPPRAGSTVASSGGEENDRRRYGVTGMRAPSATASARRRRAGARLGETR